MGLAASQARFLCITARKADCEYKSTDLAQQKLNITNQLSAISNEYANSMNATKLMWSNDTVDGDYGLTYSLLMTPSAVNDFNPYFVTSPSGAVILNGEYAAAARAAGISKAGGVGSQAQRDKFIQAMVPNGLVTKETADAITKYDFKAVKDSSGAINVIGDVNDPALDTERDSFTWNPFAGVGGVPLNKSVVDAMQLSDLINSETLGQKPFDWSILTLKDGEIPKSEYDSQMIEFSKLASLAQKKTNINSIIETLKSYKYSYELRNSGVINSIAANNGTANTAEEKKCAEMIKQIEATLEQAYKIKDSETKVSDSDWADLKAGILSMRAQFQKQYPNGGKKADTTDFNLGNSDKIDALGKYSVIINGVLSKNESKVNGLTIGDLLASNIVLVNNKGTLKAGKTEEDFLAKSKDKTGKDYYNIYNEFYDTKEDLESFKLKVGKIVDFLAEKFGRFSIDDASKTALEFAKNMTKRQFSKVTDIGTNTSTALTENSAYQNAIKYNTIGSDQNNQYLAVSLSNIISSFLTYYDNRLNMVDSDYVVGKSVEQSVYVTDNLNYYYVFQDDSEAVTNIRQKSADFYDQLYNNILANGWREDSAIDDSEYLESMIKDGRYSMSSLNQDGHYYQTRYNDTGYMVEVTDTDAIARAEAEFMAKKAELTYKEDNIDMKTKKLDLEISALTQEYQSVQSMIQNGIQKTFQLFQ